MAKAVRKAGWDALRRLGFLIRGQGQASIADEPGPSPPGTPPHTHTGRGAPQGPTAQRSLRHAQRRTAQRPYGTAANVVGTVGKVLEEGGDRKDDHYQPRPFMAPALAGEIGELPGPAGRQTSTPLTFTPLEFLVLNFEFRYSDFDFGFPWPHSRPSSSSTAILPTARPAARPPAATDASAPRLAQCHASEAKANTRATRHEMALPSMYADEIEVSFPATRQLRRHGRLSRPASTASRCRSTSATARPAMLRPERWWPASSAGTTPQTLNEVPVNKFSLKPYAVGASRPVPSFA